MRSSATPPVNINLLGSFFLFIFRYNISLQLLYALEYTVRLYVFDSV